MQQFIDKSTHSGSPQDEGYNKIQSGYPFAQLKEEATYILEENDEGVFVLTKKPEDCTLEQTNDYRAFLLTGVEKVLVVKADGRYDRYNFDFQSQFPKKDEPDTNAEGTPVAPPEENGGDTGSEDQGTEP